MKIQVIIIMAVIALFCSCQSKTAKTAASSTEKTCCADSTKSCCSNGEGKACCASPDSISMAGVQVLYFHNERRCATCMAVEDGAVELVKTINDSSVTFHSYLIGDALTADIEKKFNIDGQTLLVVGKGQIENLTDMAFMNARVKPDNYKDELKAQIEKQK